MAVYAVSDLHGHYEHYEKICKFLKPEDKVYYLGDATDRGEDNWRLLVDILQNPQWIYIMGNHDVALLEFIKHIDSRDIRFFLYNGGEKTIEQVLAAPQSDIDLVQRALGQAPYYAIYKNQNGKEIFLSHSGSENINNEEDLIWDRDHIFYKGEHDYVVHGHTPIEHIIRKLAFFEKQYRGMVYNYDTPLFYSENKICIDATVYYSGKVFLLNLDTFEWEVIE